MTPEKLTTAWVQLRCKEDEDTNCLVWQGSLSASGAPVASFRTDDGRKPTFQLRRVMWERRHGEIPDGLYVTYACHNQLCLRHLELVTKGEILRRRWAKADERAKLVAAATKASRQRAKASIDVARAVRASSDTLEVVARRYGISVTLASFIRRGERWREDRNPFAGLIASNDAKRSAA